MEWLWKLSLTFLVIFIIYIYIFKVNNKEYKIFIMDNLEKI